MPPTGRRFKNWFENTRRWSIGKQLAMAAAVILTVATTTQVISDRSQSSRPARSTSPPVEAVAQTIPQTSEASDSIAVSPDVATSIPEATTSTGISETASSTVSDTAVTSTAESGQLSALDVLQTIPVELEHRGGYDRDLFAVWSDLDNNGCDTRADVLIAESTTPAEVGPGCTVVSGNWYSTYDNTYETSPSTLDIDHVIPLKEAWDSGAYAWTPEERIAFANDTTDPRTLAAVTATSNRAKGDADPSNWLPPNDPCTYIGNWIAIKARWSMTMDPSEWGRLKNLLNDQCRDTLIDQWPVTGSGS